MNVKTPEGVRNSLRQLTQNKDVGYVHVENQFLIERAVTRLLSEPKLAQHIVFKGGFVMLQVHGSSRYTTDLGAVIHDMSASTASNLIQETMSKDIGDHVWFQFEKNVDVNTRGQYDGFGLLFRGGIGPKPSERQVLKARKIGIDIGLGDPIHPKVVTNNLSAILGGEEISWSVYPVETIIAEKLHPLCELGSGNSRSKDIYDLSILVPKADSDILAASIKKTFEFRNSRVPDDISKFLRELDYDLLERGWVRALGSIKNPPKFQTCTELIQKWFHSNFPST